MEHSIAIPPSGPTLNVSEIEQILIDNNSKAANLGIGPKIFETCVKYNIDPAILLGFFYMESNMGQAGVARFTHSIGNVRPDGPEFSDEDIPSGNYEGYKDFSVGV